MANLFDGYIESIGKRPIDKVINGNYLAEPPINSDYVGVLKKEFVQIDIDNSDDANTLYNIVTSLKIRCDVLQTSRGKHFYFINDEYIKGQSVGLYNGLGIRADVGIGSKNRVVPLRTTKEDFVEKEIDGVLQKIPTKVSVQRPFIQQYDELDVVPCWLRPLGKRDYNLKNCDTRNQTLFTYILALQNKNFTKEEIRNTIKVVNRYIFSNPLSDKEIDTITREEAFSQEIFFNEKGSFLHDRFGNYMLSNCNIVMINNQCNIYTKHGLYTSDPFEFERIMIDKIPNLKDSNRKEVYKYISLKCTKILEYSSPKYLPLKDHVLDIETNEVLPYSPNIVVANKININYDESAYNEVMDKTLDKVCKYDPQIRQLLEEMIGYSLYRKNSMQVCFILTGEGSNGKSTILNCIKKLLGRDNFTSLDLRELEDTFKPAELSGKLANIGDDISAKYLDNSSVFKKCVTGETFTVAKKYGQPFQLESYATQIFCANELPQVKDKSDGFGRRIVIVPFNAKFSKHDEDYDPFIEDKLLDDNAIEYLLKLAVDGLKRVLMNRSFTKSDTGENEKDVYLRSNNNILEYVDDSEPEIENNSVNDCYLAYQVWCAKNGYQPQKKLNFTKEMHKIYGVQSVPKYINGKTERVYEII